MNCTVFRHVCRTIAIVALSLPVQGLAGESLIYNVRELGAAGDGETLDTEAIQKAFDACGAAGGGTVLLPEGIYLSGALFMKSDTTLRLDEGAVLKGSSNLADYPMIHTRWEGTEEQASASLLNASDARNLTITGSGEIAGSGAGDSEPPAGPRVIEFINCETILIEGIRITNKGRWTVHPIYCRDVIARDLTIRTTGQNADGINPDSCDGVLIENCTFRTGDDCIAIKSGKNQQALDIGVPCRNIRVVGCEMMGGHGGVVIGSEMSGGVENVVVTDCTFRDMPRGIRIKTRRGRGGYVRDATFSNIHIRNTRDPIVINMNYGSNPGDLIEGETGLPHISGIVIDNLTIEGDRIGFAHGLEDSLVTDLTLHNIKISGHGSLDLKHIRELKMSSVPLDGLMTENVGMARE